MTIRRLNDDGYRVYGALALLASHPTVVEFLDSTEEGTILLESLYKLRDNPKLFDKFRT